MRKLISVVAGVLVLSGTMFMGVAGASGTKNYTYSNNSSGDSGTCGPDWANDSFTREFKVTKQVNSDNSYRVLETFKGDFTTIAGPSPESCEAGDSNTVAAGIVGKFTGFEVLKVSGGAYSVNETVTCAANCSTALFVAAAFGDSATYTTPDYLFQYKAKTGCAKGWVDAGTGDGGDIATSCAA